MNVKDNEIRTIITDPNGAETLVKVADALAKDLKTAGLTTAQIRALFGEVRQIEAEWSLDNKKPEAFRRLVLLKPKLAYRARRERGQAVKILVEVLDKSLDQVTQGDLASRDGNFRRFVEFFEAILAYHKSYGGN